MMTFSLPLVVAIALLPTLVLGIKGCYPQISSPHEINGVYAPYYGDSFKIINDNGEFGSYTIQKSPQDNNDYYFFKDGVKIPKLKKIDVIYNHYLRCFINSDDMLDDWPRTYIMFLKSYPMSGPFLGEISNPTKTRTITKDDIRKCAYWATQQRGATGYTWSYNDTCTAVWDGQPANRIKELPTLKSGPVTKNHMRAQLLKPIPAPGSSIERKVLGVGDSMDECVKLAKELGDAVKVVSFHKSDKKCYYSGSADYEQHTDDVWTYLSVDIAGEPRSTLNTFICTT